MERFMGCGNADQIYNSSNTYQTKIEQCISWNSKNRELIYNYFDPQFEQVINEKLNNLTLVEKHKVLLYILSSPNDWSHPHYKIIADIFAELVNSNYDQVITLDFIYNYCGNYMSTLSITAAQVFNKLSFINYNYLKSILPDSFSLSVMPGDSQRPFGEYEKYLEKHFNT